MAYRGVHLAPYSGVLAVGRDFLLWWEFIDGLYLSTYGVDLVELFQRLDADRAFNVIDSILIEEGLRDANTEESYTKVRTALRKVYNGSVNKATKNYDESDYEKMFGTRSDPSKPVKQYIPVVEPTEDGYPGLAAPLG